MNFHELEAQRRGRNILSKKNFGLNFIIILVEKLQFYEILPLKFSKKIAMTFEHMIAP